MRKAPASIKASTTVLSTFLLIVDGIVKWSQSFTSEVLLRSFCREEKLAWLAEMDVCVPNQGKVL